MINTNNFKLKYIIYKKKYLNLKGGAPSKCNKAKSLKKFDELFKIFSKAKKLVDIKYDEKIKKDLDEYIIIKVENFFNIISRKHDTELEYLDPIIKNIIDEKKKEILKLDDQNRKKQLKIYIDSLILDLKDNQTKIDLLLNHDKYFILKNAEESVKLYFNLKYIINNITSNELIKETLDKLKIYFIDKIYEIDNLFFNENNDLFIIKYKIWIIYENLEIFMNHEL
jgi:hypothetical protein